MFAHIVEQCWDPFCHYLILTVWTIYSFEHLSPHLIAKCDKKLSASRFYYFLSEIANTLLDRRFGPFICSAIKSFLCFMNGPHFVLIITNWLASKRVCNHFPRKLKKYENIKLSLCAPTGSLHSLVPTPSLKWCSLPATSIRELNCFHLQLQNCDINY